MSIGVVDIGIGNLGSVKQAIYNLGWDPVSISSPKDFSQITHLVMPGVGAFHAAMEKLKKAELVEPIREFASNGKPLLGICLGMQLMATRGSEGGEALGLGLIPGKVERMPSNSGLRIPHIGWNEAHQIRKHSVLNGIRDDVDFYFVHSYRFVVDDQNDVLAVTEYGNEFPSIVGRDNVIGIQFHPEKSQLNGVRLIDNFCMWNGKC